MSRSVSLIFGVIFGWAAGTLGHGQNQKPFTVISWNIKFLPRILAHIGHKPLKRVQPIAAHLLADSADVLVLQEAFDNVANRRLLKALRPLYPYHVGPANKKGAFKISSGILIVSRYPLKELGTVDFRSCEKEDCWARKGGLLVELSWQGRRIQVLGTHLEAGGGREIKMEQYGELAGLVQKFRENGVPQLLCGDFNTRKTDDYLYPRMLQTLEAEDGPLSGDLQYTSDHLLNDMSTYRPEDREVIDFIFYKGNGLTPSFIRRSVLRYTHRWQKGHQDLSDHFGVKAVIGF
ncbi:MAG: sphingomyelin phosphodiesterase [Flavobacteriales bacterium]|nr:sphingomyelin phosphodiesterase [Flavobacteriales bacterium]MCX7649616.1 sphingomyelin phosphodiesterase [Flavobacteriales bacterium]MDW8432071.1 sphingomyelin phosphodiesterase [Flavobacteriales bacterium]